MTRCISVSETARIAITGGRRRHRQAASGWATRRVLMQRRALAARRPMRLGHARSPSVCVPILLELKDLSANAAARELARRGYATARGGKWTARSILNLRARMRA